LEKEVDYKKMKSIPLTLRDFFSLFEDIVTFLEVHWPENLTDPDDELVISSLEKLDIRVPIPRLRL